MQITIGGAPLAVLDDITEEELQLIFPSGVTRTTNRNPVFKNIMQGYIKVIENRVLHLGLDIMSPEVRAMYAIEPATSQGAIVEFNRR